MKKITWILSLILMMGLLTACGELQEDENTEETVEKNIEETEEAVEENIEEISDIVDTFDLSFFQTTDLDGNTVTQDIFKDYDVTMVNVWATWCQYCIIEMPEIEEAYQRLPENANVISICTDAQEEEALAVSLAEQTGASFMILSGCEDFEKSVYPYLVGYPTTFFVDSEGRMIGEEIVGVPGMDGSIADAYLSDIEALLENVSKGKDSQTE